MSHGVSAPAIGSFLSQSKHCYPESRCFRTHYPAVSYQVSLKHIRCFPKAETHQATRQYVITSLQPLKEPWVLINENGNQSGHFLPPPSSVPSSFLCLPSSLETRLSHISGQPRTHHVAKKELKLLCLLPLPGDCKVLTTVPCSYGSGTDPQGFAHARKTLCQPSHILSP